ncbi:hypothetical protein E3N88_45262 [Mikania micrantha]|uniref:Uncharacterized protein n=1 Tax=Mikania micrantha TaxID=192012 RepID=A0A5N6LAB5_9ASTR|nr:hypothetical protein E3N88_45262 [Mikania micrantha]
MKLINKRDVDYGFGGDASSCRGGQNRIPTRCCQASEENLDTDLRRVREEAGEAVASTGDDNLGGAGGRWEAGNGNGND